MIKVFISQPMQDRQQELFSEKEKPLKLLLKPCLRGKMYTLLTPLFKEQKM